MKIVISKDNKIESSTAVALGNFDGIHLGHQKLIKTMVNMAKENKLLASVFTFDFDFNEFKLGGRYNHLISENQKEDILENLGVELIYKIKFCSEIKKMSAEEFIKEIIVGKLNAKLLVVGFNFRFGHNADGDVALLKTLSKKYGFKLKIIDPMLKDNKIISSTLIRDFIVKGKIRDANQMLDREYSIIGKVISGMGRGTKLGFPTANLECETDYVSPKYGVYRTKLVYGNKEYKSVTNIGCNPTFNDVGFSIETHILDFSKSIYGDNIEIKFLDFIREEEKFNSIEDLIYQVNKDIETVKRWS